MSFCFLFLQKGTAQISFPKSAVSDEGDRVYAFENARIFKDYQTVLDSATLLVRGGKIEACGLGVRIPAEAVRMNCAGKTIYPAFIDLYAAGFGMPEPKAAGKKGEKQPQMYSNQTGPFAWNEALKPEFQAAEAYVFDKKTADDYLAVGFGALLSFQADGIARGTGVLLAPNDERPHESIFTIQAANFLSFRKGKSTQNYPSSLMGVIALLRQTYLDGKWYEQTGNTAETNLSLEAWNANQNLPQFFEGDDVYDALRIGQIAKEFSKKYVIRGGGDEYQRIEAIKALNMPFILSLDFPESHKISNPYEALELDLAQMKHWEMAPSNAARLAAAGVTFVFTSDGLKKKQEFLTQIRIAIEAGLDEKNALRALTQTPAEIIGVQGKLGTLESGKYANFILTDGAIFDKKAKILETWSLGKQHIVQSPKGELESAQSGRYNLRLDGDMMLQMDVEWDDKKAKITVLKGDEKIKTECQIEQPMLSISFALKEGAFYQLSGTMEGTEMLGKGTNPTGRWIDWIAQRTEDLPKKADKEAEKEEKSASKMGSVNFPFGGYGWEEKPVAEVIVVQNATVWTGEKAGVLTEADVLISNGKIQKVGKKINVPDKAKVIDGRGKYLTAGIVDEHSHIAITRGVNEGTQESTAEVRIGDVLDATDVNIYRQLAGGVTSSHLLHGSANPIGGQTQLVKLRWGTTPEEMKFEGWDGFIKFALGENVKQSNWGDDNTIRFPQTRMGVEQVYVDYFNRAKEYGLLKKSGKVYRRDLELDCLLEIIEKKRFITCHSYVQSEINMLMKVAEQFDFRVNTFTHILEGYKVADKMAAHGAGGSTFSDWWAYKFEVYQAIPYNAALMQAEGVTVAINSDDREMARRLNQEAAKSVKYGGMSEEEAWKMVTLNPAKLLHVDSRVGSIKEGKDADLVLWTANPLSVYAQVEATWVDGVRYFDRAVDLQKRQDIQTERARILAKMLEPKNQKKAGELKGKGESPEYHCDSDQDEG